jgi:dephospho-CoA kinase
MRIIGITGTLGAGKGTVVELLMKEYGFKHYSVREYLLEIIRERQLPENRDSMTLVANELRANNSPSFIVEQLLRRAEATAHDSIIESIRTLGEVEALRKASPNFILLAVDADAKIRYDRVFNHRKSETDNITFDKFLADEAREMNNTDPNKQNLAGCIAAADYNLDNSGAIENLFERVREAMERSK